MSPVQTVGEVLDGIQCAKTGASDFRTNLFVPQAKLQAWIDHGELFRENREGATFFLRKDRDFWHLYFCAACPAALQRQVGTMSGLSTMRVVADLVGSEAGLSELLGSLASVGFRRHLQLQRMARAGRPDELQPAGGGLPVVGAEKSDCGAILELVESAFDRYGEQLPALYEVESAVENRQILVVKRDRNLAGLLFFETQGLASTVRFWVVAEQYRALRVGSALMQHYLRSERAVRRFTLWVDSANENAIRKYGHYGYRPEGLIDYVLVNSMIPA